jgi:hypothetical protein
MMRKMNRWKLVLRAARRKSFGIADTERLLLPVNQ